MNLWVTWQVSHLFLYLKYLASAGLLGEEEINGDNNVLGSIWKHRKDLT